MIFLQFFNDTINISSEIAEPNLWYKFEMFLIILVIIYQFYHTFDTYQEILELRNIFKKKINIRTGYIEKENLRIKDKSISNITFFEDSEHNEELLIDHNILRISIAETTGQGIICRIKDNINNYLLNNYGAGVNFSIIKDIIDREVEMKDEEISNSVTTPLYLGLAATMVGIIFGLFAMPELNGDHFSNAIDALISGVKLAMIGSLFGLVCTTALSSFFYKNAKKCVEEDKNNQLSYLMGTLLPELIKAEDTGVSGLKHSLNEFSKKATDIVLQLKVASAQTGENIRKQLDVISKIETLNIVRISRMNLEVFEKLEKNMSALDSFSNYLMLMNKISDNLVHFANRTENVDVISNEIKTSIHDSYKLTEFLTSHLQEIANTGNVANNAVNFAHSSFANGIEILARDINHRLSKLNDLSANKDSQLISNMEKLNDGIKDATKNHLELLTSSYNNAVPHFEPLDNLALLPDIKNDNANQSKELIHSLNQLNTSLNIIMNKINDKPILSKLENIGKILKNKNPDLPRISLLKKLLDRFKPEKKAEKNEKK